MTSDEIKQLLKIKDEHPETDTQVRHSNGETYTLDHLCLVQIDGTWLEGVNYRGNRTGMHFTRLLEDFTNFTLVQEEKCGQS